MSDLDNVKERFIAALNLLPEDLMSMIDLKFGEVTEVSASPTDVEDAIKIQAQVAANFNNAFLMPLSGLPLVHLALRIGQHNPVIQGMLLSMLRYGPTMEKTSIQIANFEDGANYVINENLQKVVVAVKGSATAITGQFSGPLTADVEFDHEDGRSTWEANISGMFSAEDVGEYTLSVVAEFLDADTPATATVNFSLSVAEAN